MWNGRLAHSASRRGTSSTRGPTTKPARSSPRTCSPRTSRVASPSRGSASRCRAARRTAARSSGAMATSPGPPRSSTTRSRRPPAPATILAPRSAVASPSHPARRARWSCCSARRKTMTRLARSSRAAAGPLQPMPRSPRRRMPGSVASPPLPFGRRHPSSMRLSTGGRSTRRSAAVCGRGPRSTSRAARSDSATSCRTAWPSCTRNRRWRASTCCARRAGSSARATCSTGGTSRAGEGCARASRTTSCGCLSAPTTT